MRSLLLLRCVALQDALSRSLVALACCVCPLDGGAAPPLLSARPLITAAGIPGPGASFKVTWSTSPHYVFTYQSGASHTCLCTSGLAASPWVSRQGLGL